LKERLNGVQEVSGLIPLSSIDLKAFSYLGGGFSCLKLTLPVFIKKTAF